MERRLYYLSPDRIIDRKRHATIVKPKTFVAGTVGLSADVNSDFDTIYNDYNGNITNDNIAASALIADTKLAQITTASKVSGAAITLLASVPSAAGFLPAANGGLQSNTKDINPTNLLSNGDFESWSLGAALAPDGWTLSGAGASVAREASTIKLGTYSCKLTQALAGTSLICTDLAPTRGIAYWKGRTITLGAWVWCDAASCALIRINDGVANYNSSIHTGGSTWEWLTVTATISNSATTLYTYLSVQVNSKSAYFDGAIMVEGSSAFAFSPKPDDLTGLKGTFIANQTTPVTISNANVAITDCIIISLNTIGGTVGVQPHVATITAGTGFTVVCTASDTSTYNYALIK